MSISRRIFRIEQAVRRFVNRVLGRRYYLSFVEEMVLNPDYEGYIGGRVEVSTINEAYPIREIRFFTNDIAGFETFRNRWDLKHVTLKRLRLIDKQIGLDLWEEA